MLINVHQLFSLKVKYSPMCPSATLLRAFCLGWGVFLNTFIFILIFFAHLRLPFSLEYNHIFVFQLITYTCSDEELLTTFWFTSKGASRISQMGAPTPEYGLKTKMHENKRNWGAPLAPSLDSPMISIMSWETWSPAISPLQVYLDLFSFPLIQIRSWWGDIINLRDAVVWKNLFGWNKTRKYALLNGFNDTI